MNRANRLLNLKWCWLAALMGLLCAVVPPASALSATQAAKLLASDGEAGDHFGISVSISGDTALVGAYFDDDNGSASGSAYVYVRNGSSWTQQAKLTANDGTEADRFGISVSISGDTALIGAIGDADNGNVSGSAYVFVRSGLGGWTQQGKLTPDDGSTSDFFGWSVAISADTALIAAFLDDDNGSASGSAYIFTVRPANIAIGLGSYPASGGYVEQVSELPPYANTAWPRIPWTAYNATNGETRPALCDLDGNGEQDLVVGLGSGGAGYLAIYRDTGTWQWIQVPWSAYNGTNGETYPACGDLDNDGRDEIVAGLGNGGGGYAYAFDDANASYAALSGGWMNIGWAAYSASNGATHPAMENLDSDPAEEIVLGTGAGGERYVRLIDDAASGFAPGAWVRAGNTGSIASINHEVWPAVCDSLLVFGASSSTGTGGQGWLHLVSPLSEAWLQVPWGAYNAAVGATYPSCGDIDGDGLLELAVGLGAYPADGGYVALFNDFLTTPTPTLLGWPRVHWDAYNAAVGATRPAMPR